MPPHAAKKKIKKAKKVGQIKAAGAGLESFVDWVDPISSELAEERGKEICLASLLDSKRGCANEMQVLKGRLPSAEELDCKQPKWSGLDGEVQKSAAVITVDSP